MRARGARGATSPLCFMVSSFPFFLSFTRFPSIMSRNTVMTSTSVQMANGSEVGLGVQTRVISHATPPPATRQTMPPPAPFACRYNKKRRIERKGADPSPDNNNNTTAANGSAKKKSRTSTPEVASPSTGIKPVSTTTTATNGRQYMKRTTTFVLLFLIKFPGSKVATHTITVYDVKRDICVLPRARSRPGAEAFQRFPIFHSAFTELTGMKFSACAPRVAEPRPAASGVSAFYHADTIATKEFTSARGILEVVTTACVSVDLFGDGASLSSIEASKPLFTRIRKLDEFINDIQDVDAQNVLGEEFVSIARCDYKKVLNQVVRVAEIDRWIGQQVALDSSRTVSHPGDVQFHKEFVYFNARYAQVLCVDKPTPDSVTKTDA